MANYPLINAACGMQEGTEIEAKEEGAFMNAPLLDALEANLNDKQQKVADAEQKATQAEQNLADLQAKYDALQSDLTAAQEAKTNAEKALADANDAHADAIAKKDEEIKNLTDGKAKADEELKGAKDALATATQSLADKDAQIAALTEEAGKEPEAGAAPENNGEGAKTQTLRAFDPSKYKTNAERKAAFQRYMRGEEE